METKNNCIMTQPKKLIEVAMPIKEISAECVRDDRIQHGHISSLHKWWARRPLPVCRAVVFASLVPDPLDVNCPQTFRDAIEILLCKENNTGDPYSTYKDIPWTAVIDPMEDNLRNRLQMFIGKFTEDMQQSLLHNATKPTSGNQLSNACLIKWDNKNNEAILGKARKLIFVSHQCTAFGSTKTASELLVEFDYLYGEIKQTEQDLYSLPDRHLETENSKQLTENLHIAIEAFLDRMPKVFDPFAGGGAIPLEAARLGCRSFGNDINPVAHIIEKGSIEFPQKFGKPITFSKEEFIKIYGENEWNSQTQENKIVINGIAVSVNIKNHLSFDVEYYAKQIINNCKEEIGNLYPTDINGNMPISYYWARTGICSNPSCKAEVPLLRGFYVANTKTKHVYLNPIIADKKINFEIKNGKYNESCLEGWNNRGNLKCPHCGSITDVKLIKQQNIESQLGERILAVIYDGENGKEYRLPTEKEESVTLSLIAKNRPTEKMQRNSAGGDTFSWGITEWGQLFSDRQLIALDSLVRNVKLQITEMTYYSEEYKIALITYLGIWVDRMASRMTKFGLIDLGGEKVVDLFGRQAIPMVFDYPEMNIFKLEQISWIVRYINSEGVLFNYSTVYNSTSGEKNQFDSKSINSVITDPPYYDAMAYADLSDFFYIWLKKTLHEVYPLNFATPQTPKTEECTALKHHHNGDQEKAKKHFENKLLQIFDAIEHQTSDIVSIMFAHQSTEAWTTLCNSILGAKMNIKGSWAIDTEKQGGLKENKAFLSSSVTVACKPTERNGFGDYKQVKKEIEKTVAKEVEELYALGFRGADLLTACFGQAVSEFGKYEKVERADGSDVSVAELLEMARESAFNALLKGFDGDDFTKFYIGWLQLYSFTESDFDDAAKFSRVGLTINVHELFTEHILIKHNGNKQTLGTFEERFNVNKNLGDKSNSFLIDQVHRGMALFKGTNRGALLQYIAKIAIQPESNFWRVLTSICELLPNGCEDHKQAIGLLANKDSLIRESKTVQPVTYEQGNLFE
jgi:adenine-specific DNA methylase